MRRLIAASIVLSLAVPAAHAQLVPPPHWRTVLDRPARQTNAQIAPSDSVARFVGMPPGFHVTMGPGALLFDPRYFADGRFRLEAVLIPFPGSSNQEYGVFVGGTDLEGAGRSYVAFVLRRDGSAAAFARRGSADAALQPWTRFDAVVRVDSSTARNVLLVAAGTDSVTVSVNGTRLFALPRSAAPLDGAFGLRIGPAVDIHVTRVDLTAELAPVPRR